MAAAKSKLVKKVSGEERVVEISQPTSGKLKGRFCVMAMLTEEESRKAPIKGARAVAKGCFGANAEGKKKALAAAEALGSATLRELFKKRK